MEKFQNSFGAGGSPKVEEDLDTQIEQEIKAQADLEKMDMSEVKREALLDFDSKFEEIKKLRNTLSLNENLYFKLKPSPEKSLLKDKIAELNEEIKEREAEYEHAGKMLKVMAPYPEEKKENSGWLKKLFRK